MPSYALPVALLVVCGLAPAFAQTSSAPAGLVAPAHLRCEYLIDPLGIDETQPRLSWEMVDSRRGAKQTAYQILAANDPKQLDDEHGDLWDTGKVVSDESIQIPYAGKPLRSRMRVWWKVRVWDQDDKPSAWSAPARWAMGLLEAGEWKAKWIGDPVAPPPIARKEGTTQPTDGPEALPPPMLRKPFAVAGGEKIERATVYVTALGLYELHINGQRVGDHILAPEWTDYQKRVQYQTYDVTDLVRAGENVVGAQLGDGWYAGRIGLTQIVPGGPIRAIYGRQPRLLLQLEIELAEGGTQTIVSDESWRFTTEGPIRVSDLLDGEIYDAQREMPGWDASGFDDSAWKPVGTFGSPAIPGSSPTPAVLVAQPNEPIRVLRQLRPVDWVESRPGLVVYDYGQNMVGWCRLVVRGPAGATVTLRHAEVLDSAGSIYTANLRSAKQTDEYMLRGSGMETFEPHFTYHGFRYVEVSGSPEMAGMCSIGYVGNSVTSGGADAGCVFHSAAPDTGSFECSEPLLNKLMQNIVWTQRANMPSIPTDCPQRDERLGWMGDILAFAQTACFNMDMAAFFTKWVPDIRDAQADDGRYPDFAPHPFDPNARFSGVPAWGDAGVFVPWAAYVNYADRRLLQHHFESVKRWVDWIRENNADLLWKNKRHNDYGDWLNADTLQLEGWPKKGAEVPKEVFATMFFARSVELAGKMAKGLDRPDDAQKYTALAKDIKAAFNRAYVSPDGRIQGDTQAGYALALAFDILPDALRPQAATYMLEAFKTYKGNISTGFHSTVPLMQELTRSGHNDEAYRLIENRTMPSWGYAIDHGATTIWERWDGYVEGRGFQNPGMNSFSHYAIGSVGEWMYRTILGINPDETQPGYKHFILRPRPGGGLTWAKGYYDSIRGRIASAWHVENAQLMFELTIPANSTATLYLPTTDARTVTESDGPAVEALGVKPLGIADGAAAFELTAGHYLFKIPAPRP